MKLGKSVWGLYPWWGQSERDKKLVHPMDFERFKAFFPPVTVFECIGETGDYLILQHGDEQFRVKPDLFREISEPIFKIGDIVEMVTGTL